MRIDLPGVLFPQLSRQGMIAEADNGVAVALDGERPAGVKVVRNGLVELQGNFPAAVLDPNQLAVTRLANLPK